MTNTVEQEDLIVLTADANMEAAVRGILQQHGKLGIRQVQANVRRHPQRDPGCRVAGVEFLAPFKNQYSHALLMFDHEGCGEENTLAVNLETQLTRALANDGWDDRAKAIVLVPELEIWVWSDSPHVDAALGWHGREPNLRQWLVDEHFLIQGQSKPERPKEAMEAALRLVKKPRSSARYADLAAKVGFNRCTDQAFVGLKSILQTWFSDGA